MMNRIKLTHRPSQEEKDKIAAAIRAKRVAYVKKRITRWSIILVALLYFIVLVWSIVEIRKTEKPELGVCLIPKGTWPYEHYSNLKWVDCEPKE